MYNDAYLLYDKNRLLLIEAVKDNDKDVVNPQF